MDEYHTVLDRLEGAGIDVADFRIPDSEVTPIVRSIPSFSFGNRPAGPAYSREKYVKKPYFLTKLDYILGYFEITASDKPREIGFRTPNKK